MDIKNVDKANKIMPIDFSLLTLSSFLCHVQETNKTININI